MNAIKFNKTIEDLPTYQKERIKKDFGFCTETDSLSPLIVWNEDSAEDFKETDFREAFTEFMCPRLHFSKFRVSGKYTTLDGGWYKFKAWVKKISENKYVVAIKQTETSEIKNVKDFCLLVVEVSYSGKFSSSFIPLVGYKVLSFDGKGSQVETAGLTQDIIWSVACEWINKLVIDFYNPSLFLAKKNPKLPNGKSVLWEKAREHFVFIHKSHPANSQESFNKKTISDGNTIDRVAHSRRAHFRLLRSPKFKNKAGQKIWIKSSWIGPKEWADQSGQIYKIIEKE